MLSYLTKQQQLMRITVRFTRTHYPRANAIAVWNNTYAQQGKSSVKSTWIMYNIIMNN